MLILIPLFIAGCSEEKIAETPPNIILIITDDQGWTQTSHLADPGVPGTGSDFYETPNMDRLAESGILFSQGYSPNPICSPTRHSLLFGQNAARHIYNKDLDWYKNTQDWLTIPKVIKAANPEYKTAHIGKWHVGKMPAEAGYDYDDGLTSNSMGEWFDGEYLRSRDYTQQMKDYIKENKIDNPGGQRTTGNGSMYWTDKNPKDIFGLTRRAIDFMQGCIDENIPFYVQVSHYATHSSLISRKETYEYFKSKEPGKKHKSPPFAAMLKDLDTGIGMLLDFVKEAGIEDNTYIFLMSDNGGVECFNQMAFIDENKNLANAHYAEVKHRNIPLREGKHSFYEGGIRVPFLAAGPKIKPGRVSDIPVSGLDFLPTFAELAGYKDEFPESIDGGSLVPILFNENVKKVERNMEGLLFHQALHRVPRSAYRKGDFKLVKIWTEEGKYENSPKVELYDLSKDLGETTDLSEKYPEIRKEMEAELLDFLEKVNAETGERKIRGPYYRYLDDLESVGRLEELEKLNNYQPSN
jgi:arylsulfatase A-like enzyme